MVLDEPSAALDPSAECEFFEQLRVLCRTRSVLLISHRLAHVRCADRIYVLRDGAVAESGTHAQLVEHAEAYSRLFKPQLPHGARADAAPSRADPRLNASAA